MKDRTSFKCGSGTRDLPLPTTRGWVRARFEIQPAALQLTTDAVFPVPPTANVLWKAEVPDPSASLEYSFYLYNRGNGGWSLARPYNGNNTFNWTPGTAGTYALQVWARRAGSSAQYDLWRGTDFLDVFSTPARLKPLTVNATFPGSVGHADHMDGDRERRNDDRARVPVHHLQSDRPAGASSRSTARTEA